MLELLLESNPYSLIHTIRKSIIAPFFNRAMRPDVVIKHTYPLLMQSGER